MVIARMYLLTSCVPVRLSDAGNCVKTWIEISSKTAVEGLNSITQHQFVHFAAYMLHQIAWSSISFVSKQEASNSVLHTIGNVI